MRSKFTAFVLLLSLLHVAFSFSSSHADFNICKARNGNFPMPGSYCRAYYKCVNFRAIKIECPEDQHFFPTIESCVWPEDYPCLEKLKSEKCPLPDGKFVKQNTRCKVYYHCRKGVPTERRCAGELLFDDGMEKCEYPEYVTCLEDVRTTETISQSTPIITASTLDATSIKENVITSTVPPASSTRRRSTTDSDENSSKEGNSSEENDHSSTKSEMKSTTFISSSTTESRTKTVSITEDISTVSSAISEEISTASSAIIEDISTIFDKTGGSSEEDNQPSTDSENKPTTPSISTLFKSSLVTENRTKPVSLTVSEGISTVSDEKEEYTDPNTVNDKSTSPTKHLENKDTDSTTITSGITDSVTFHIFCPKPNGYFPHPNDRHKFIACVAGDPIIMDCPEDLVYNDKLRSCEYE